DLELIDGEVRLKGVPQMKRTLAEVAHALSGVPGFALPGNMAPGLAAAADFQPPALTYTNGAHVVEAEVDGETGGVRLTRYVIVHDCGRMINPMMVEGQVHGAVVPGIGATLLEWMRYDSGGQPLTVTFADYLLPTVDVVPSIEIHHMESPTPLNPRGQGRGRERRHRRAGRHRLRDRRRVASAQGAHPGVAGNAGAAAGAHSSGDARVRTLMMRRYPCGKERLMIHG